MLLLGCAALRHARPGRTAVLVLGLVLLGAAAAEAQTVRTLVSNVFQTGDDSANTSGNDHAQLFHTGANANGYTLTSVTVNSDDVEDDDFDVEVCEEDGTSDEFPSTAAGDCAALTAPASFVGLGNVVFTHTGLALSANTNYVVVIKQRGTGSVMLDSTTSSGEDASGLSDWSIKNKFYWKSGSTWMIKSGSNEALSIIVFGYANTVDASDATLSALSVSGATLSPAFGAATTSYHAVVANSVNQGTITLTTSESTATVEYLDGSDATLTDADTMTAGLQVNLSVGTNTVKVKVTAPDTTTTETYTVNVFRAAVPVACSAASMQNRIWTGNLTVGHSSTSSSSSAGYFKELTGVVRFGSISDDSFTLNATSYSVIKVSLAQTPIISQDELQLTITPALGGDAQDLVLHIGTNSFALADATNTPANTFNWENHGLTWADGDAVCLALTADGPTVSSVALTSAPGTDNTYAIGDTVTATVTFDAAVDITGTPQLELDFDGTPKLANCTAATNVTTMACEYEVVADDVAAGGVAIAANKLTGGTIYTTGSTTISADLDHTSVAIDADHKVDGIRPTLVTTGTDAPTTSTDGMKVILTFSEDISAVSLSDIDVAANSTSGYEQGATVSRSGRTVTLTLILTIQAGWPVTVALSADAVEDPVGNGILALAATTVTNAVGSTTAPTVTGVALTSDPGSDNTYAITSDVEATVTFDAAVDITGNPQLELDFDGTAKLAACTAATNTTTMACEYEVAVGDSAPNGIAIAANKLTGGTITATGSTTTADLDHSAVAIAADHKVDGIRPTLVTTGPDAPTTSTDGTKVILTFSEPVDREPVDRSAITIRAGGNVVSTTAASVTGTKVEITLTTALTDTTATLTVELGLDAVVDTANNGNLDAAATTVTNAVGTTVSNTAPMFANLTETRSVAENSGGGTAVGNPVTAIDTDGGDTLTYTLEGMDASSFSIVSTSGQIRTRSGVTYDYETTPSYTVIVKADDNNGGTDTVTVTIDLTDVDEPPLAPVAPRVTATPNTTDSLTVSWSAPSNTGRPAISSYDLQYREGTGGNWTDRQGVSGTSATIAGLTGDLTAYQVQVRATNSDGAGPWSPSGRIRTAPPPPVNNPPLAVDDAADTPEDTLVTIDVLGNDSDPDRNTLTVVEVSAPTHGTAVVADTGAVVYTPEPDFHGTDRFTYVVGDGSGLTARAAVDVTVRPVNDPPLAGDDTADTREDTPVTIDVLGNDSDVEGDALTVVEASAPTNGTAVVADTGAVVYTPEPDFHGTDRFTYVVGDGSGLTARAAVDVTVRPVNDPPLAAGVIPDRTLDIGDGPAVLDLIPFFADRDDDALGYTAVVSDQAVALRLTGETLTLTATRPGTATVTVTAQDPGGLTATQAFMVTTTDHQEARNVKAWLARFGRTVANHAAEAVRGRMSSTQGSSRRVTLGGAELKKSPALEITQASPWDELTPEDQRPENFNSLRMREFLLSSSFEVSLAQNATQDPGPGWTAWGGAARTSFSGRDSDLSIDGDVTTATLGVDRAWDRVLLGLALGRSTGDGSYSTGDTGGDLKSSITSAHPYLRFSLNDRLSTWTLLGYGKGELTLTHEGGGEKTDIEMKMAALGARGALVAAGGFDLAVRTDALLVRTSSEETSEMAKTEADVSRLRLVLEGSRPFASASGASLTPSVEVGVRRDGGDAERGMGFEMGGGMRYANPSIGLTVEITARRLMAHEQSGYSEWGAGGSLQFALGGAERGFSARLGSSVGTTASGVEGLWAMGDTRGLTGGAQAPGRVDAEAGYAMGAFGGSGVITPYGGFSMSGDRRYRAGWRLRLGDSFNLSLEGDRTENPDLPSRHGVAVRGDLRW